VQRIEVSAFASRVRWHFDDEAPAQKLDIDQALAQPASGLHLYVCGPKSFMDAVLRSARAQGWPKTQLHYEFFAAEVASSTDANSFEVQLASTGKVVVVPPGISVIQALAAEGVDLPFSCEQGVCGTCLTRVLQGVPDHKDVYLTPEEQAANDQFMPCCSRAKTPRLVLDI
jgi:vanillate O-demethylase ferredoxin subunit